MDATQFDSDAWIARMAAAIENDVSRSDAPRLDYPERAPLVSAEGDRMWRLAQYRTLAKKGKTDAIAAQQFAQSHLRFGFEPTESKSILHKHPVLAGADSGPSRPDAVRFQLLSLSIPLEFDSLMPRLAKISLVNGADCAARLLHRFLTDGMAGRLPAKEIVVVHGLSLKARVDLTEGAYLEPYEDARRTYSLPENPVQWMKSAGLDPGRRNRSTATAVLVRPFSWNPGFPMQQESADNAFEAVHYSFPHGHTVESLGGMFRERSLLIDLLSVVVGSRLVFHTVFVELPDWIRQIEPSLVQSDYGSSASLFDVWPKDRELNDGDAETFASMARGWIAYRRKRHSIDLAVRRVASSLSPPLGKFGMEDRLIDVSVAMEAMYGPLKTGKIGRKLKSRASCLLAQGEDRADIEETVGHFYKTRSDIVHGDEPPPRDELESTLDKTRELARRSLAALLPRDGPPDWSRPLDSAGASGSGSTAEPAKETRPCPSAC